MHRKILPTKEGGENDAGKGGEAFGSTWADRSLAKTWNILPVRRWNQETVEQHVLQSQHWWQVEEREFACHSSWI